MCSELERAPMLKYPLKLFVIAKMKLVNAQFAQDILRNTPVPFIYLSIKLTLLVEFK